MKHTFKVGDKIRMKESCLGIDKGEILKIEKSWTGNLLVKNSLNYCMCQDKWLPLTNRGKNTRDPKTGRFIKMSHHKAVKLSSTLSGQQELLRNHENRIKRLEIILTNR